ncbi:MAG: FKBP-type peptidyl-prolyl cis-trans isomerase [Bacteroidales bacterium]|nr:FKBP-type peptidyl-prolyl cis-trans isomerase [Bacteroidales bacterium]
MKKIQFLFLSFIVLFTSCNRDSEGYYTAESGLKYQYLKENAKGKKAKTGDYVKIKMAYANSSDSVLFNTKELGGSIKMQIHKPAHKASFNEALLMLKTGERALFKIRADSFYLRTRKEKIPAFIKNNEYLTFDIELLKILSKKEILKEQKLLEEQRKKDEENLLNYYLNENNIKQEPSISGLYYIETKAGTGKKAMPGNVLTVHYTGKFLSGEIFDSSYKRNQPFRFQLGAGNVIPGWEEGFSKMCEGGKATFIIPSYLAYGKKGYGKIIPPYTTLIFEVALLKVN